MAHWMSIYPIYLDGKRSIAQGRKVSKEIACPGSPNPQNIAATAHALGMQFVLEPGKAHPKEPWIRGRVKVELQGKDNRKQVLVKISEEILKMKVKFDEAVASGAIQLPTNEDQQKKSSKKSKKKK
jgi:signal recognition particle subunit SRP19